eukprot:COSAG06_NODE_2306_length_7110_cov_99.335188_11_plen_81_part_00
MPFFLHSSCVCPEPVLAKRIVFSTSCTKKGAFCTERRAFEPQRDVGVAEAELAETVLTTARKRFSFGSFPYVCPEPGLVK